MNFFIKPLSLLAAILLFIAFYPHHLYGYFIVLKWMVFITSTVHLIHFYNLKEGYSATLSIVLIVLFNPFFRIPFHRDIWLIIDGLSAIWFLFQVLREKKLKT